MDVDGVLSDGQLLYGNDGEEFKGFCTPDGVGVKLLQRAGIPVAVATSVKVARQSPVTIAKWGLIVAVLMALGSIPFFLGLIIVLPILGHATWYLYRAAVPRASEG